VFDAGAHAQAVQSAVKSPPIAVRYQPLIDGQESPKGAGVAVASEILGMAGFGFSIGFVSDAGSQVVFLMCVYFVRALLELWWFKHKDNYSLTCHGTDHHHANWAWSKYRSRIIGLRRLNLLVPEIAILFTVFLAPQNNAANLEYRDEGEPCGSAGQQVEGLVMTLVTVEIMTEIVLLVLEAFFKMLKNKHIFLADLIPASVSRRNNRAKQHVHPPSPPRAKPTSKPHEPTKVNLEL
jgi:hypothetical protein